MLLNIVLLIVGLCMLIKGANVLVVGASWVARKFNIPEIIIGLTIVACGTSAPEAAISISSVINGADGISIGNVLGSNIANIFLILGVCAIISKLRIKKNTVYCEIPFLIFISILLLLIGWQCGVISRFIAFVFLCLFISFLMYLYFVCRKKPDDMPPTENMSLSKMILFVVFGIAALVFGAKITVNSAVNIAHALNVSERVIGLTLIALGTSLPELVTCAVATVKKHTDIAIGNVVGSNIFNILFILGITGLIHPIHFDYAFLTDALWGILATVLLFVCIVFDSHLTKRDGVIFLTLYFAYMLWVLW